MSNGRMIVIGEKESFIVRVLISKAQDAGVGCEFVPCVIDDIAKKIEGTSLITLYMDDDSMPQEDILHFLTDKMSATFRRSKALFKRNSYILLSLDLLIMHDISTQSQIT